MPYPIEEWFKRFNGSGFNGCQAKPKQIGFMAKPNNKWYAKHH
jgi:hypothetical protein